MKHYFEIISLRDILSEKIQLELRLISTLKGWIGVFSSGLITGFSMRYSLSPPVASISLPIIAAFGALLILAIGWHIWASIRLNEAKDVMYICLGIDIDNPKVTSPRFG